LIRSVGGGGDGQGSSGEGTGVDGNTGNGLGEGSKTEANCRGGSRHNNGLRGIALALCGIALALLINVRGSENVAKETGGPVL
jgi:hypothetical protein